ncbi:hypothetical protein [Streptomyces djakartensis]|jgi:hypothetical protein|uniref:hypothetical protein n=1 Tax=Streptomyces djakartensis TaxID=68193 RepID=UPI0034DF9D35
MLDTTQQSDPAPPQDEASASPDERLSPRDEAPALPEGRRFPRDEPRGCLFALSQPPLMIFLAVIGTLLLMASLHDLLLL